jgi:tetratricopeptide (TPR) repeat protein
MSRIPIHCQNSTVCGGCRLAVLCLLLALGSSSSSAAASLKPPEIKAKYREVLGVLATGDLDAALVDLMEFETGVVGDEQPWLRMESFWRIKLRALRDLLNAETLDLLRPVIVLHSEAYFEYGNAGRRFMAGHSRLMATELAEIYALRVNAPEARVFSGSVLTNFGVVLWTPTNIVQSSDLFLRATSADPGNSLALLGLGTAYEHAGNYERAIRYLSGVLRLEGENHLASLRLALCQLRASEDFFQEATLSLENLTQSDAPEWIRSIAYQELARQKLKTADLDAAEALLQMGLQDIPRDQQLSVLLGSVYDLKRRPKDTIQVLDAIPENGWNRVSPRQIYSNWEPVGVEETRARLRVEMASGLEPLQKALGNFVEEGTAP